MKHEMTQWKCFVPDTPSLYDPIWSCVELIMFLTNWIPGLFTCSAKMFIILKNISAKIVDIHRFTCITSFYRTFGCPIIYTDMYSQCYFGHWHLQQCLIQLSSLVSHHAIFIDNERNNQYYFFLANQQKAGTKIYSLTQCSLSVNECDWYILAGNDERINTNCLIRASNGFVLLTYRTGPLVSPRTP